MPAMLMIRAQRPVGIKPPGCGVWRFSFGEAARHEHFADLSETVSVVEHGGTVKKRCTVVLAQFPVCALLSGDVYGSIENCSLHPKVY